MSDNNECAEHFLVTDSLHLQAEDRPSVVQALQNPRDYLAISLLFVGSAMSICNILGKYDDEIYLPLESCAISLGILSGFAAFLQVMFGYKVSALNRRGLADDPKVNIYGGIYSLAVSWLALRASNVCPIWLSAFDWIIPQITTLIFFLSAVTPAMTLFGPDEWFDDTPELSETELLRMRGLLGIGILGAVFAPDTISFAIGGSQWWDRVSLAHTAQRTLESSTALFALFSTEASMIAHRCGKVGVAPFRTIVPAFAAVCFALAILPCGAALYWLKDDISFFSFYRD